MMKSLQKIVRKLTFPPLAIMLALVPISVIMLVFSMVFVGTENPIAYISYVISAYTLYIWCFKIPKIVAFFKRIKNENKYVVRWRSDPRLRVKVSLYGALGVNTTYALFQLWLGVYHGTFWFTSIGAYYICLVLMRWLLLRYTNKHGGRGESYNELRKYRACGLIFLVMNLYISIITFFMIKFGRTFEHNMITAIAMAVYTFGALTLAIINLVKFRKYKSPIFSASKSISLAAACVSILTLESTLITTFGADTMTEGDKTLFLALTGAAVSATVLAMAIYMIAYSTQKITKIKKEENNEQSI